MTSWHRWQDAVKYVIADEVFSIPNKQAINEPWENFFGYGIA